MPVNDLCLVLHPHESIRLGDDCDINRATNGFFGCGDMTLRVSDRNLAFTHICHALNYQYAWRFQRKMAPSDLKCDFSSFIYNFFYLCIKFFIARDVTIMNKGEIKIFNHLKGYGFIKVENSEDVFFHISEVKPELASLISTKNYRDEPICFDINESDKGLVAVNINIDLEKRKLGYVVIREKNGEPFPVVKEINTNEEYSLFFNQMKVRPFSYVNFEDREDDPVIFSAKDGSNIAKDFVLIDSRRYILSFAEFTCDGCDSHQGYIKNLTSLVSKYCSDESWDYIQNKDLEENRQRAAGIPVMLSYMDQTCKRIVEQNKLIIGTSKDGKEFAYFNTGLADNFQNEIFAYFIKNDDFSENQPWGVQIPKWHFLEFNTSESKYRKYFPGRVYAEIASYFEPNTKLVLDPEDLKSAIPNWEHLQERKGRIAVYDLNNMPEQDFRDAIEDSIDLAYKRIKRNYKTAIPQFYSHEIQFLVPLYSRKDRSKALAAMVVRQDESIYEISTILTLDQAYNNARLLAKPDREWLNP